MEYLKLESNVLPEKIPVLMEFNSGTEHFNLSTNVGGYADINCDGYVRDRGFYDTNNLFLLQNAAAFTVDSADYSVGDNLGNFYPANLDSFVRYGFVVNQKFTAGTDAGMHLKFCDIVNGSPSTSRVYNGGSILGSTYDPIGHSYTNLMFAVKLNDTTHDLHGYALFLKNYDPVLGYMGLQASSVVFVVETLDSLNKQNFVVTDSDLPEDIFGPESDPEGYGQPDDINPGGNKPALDHSSDSIGIPSMPTVGVTTAGFYHVYKVTQGLLQNFGAKLFPSLGNIAGELSPYNSVEEALSYFTALLFNPAAVTGVTIGNQAISVVDMLMNGKAIDYVVDCHIIPVTPATSGSSHIQCGAREIDISAPVVTSDYIDFDCGAVSIPLQYQNFMDFTQCKCKLFLPFVGFVDLKPEFWHGGTVSVKYRFNVIDGSFMAYVTSTSCCSKLSGSLIAQYGGVSCLHIPVTGLNYASMISGLVTGSMNLAGNVASGNLAGAAGSALSLANMRPDVAQSNNYNCSTSFLGCRRPYMVIERALPCISGRYPHDQGIPLNVYVNLGSVSGYTEISAIDLTGIGATAQELDELESLLKEGVYF